jgi:putative aldouronate transport system permease protein
VVCALFVYPILYVASRSVMPDVERVSRPLALVPLQFDFTAYRLIFAPNSNLLLAYSTTVRRVLVGTSCNLVVTALMAYVLSKRYYPWRTFFTAMLAFTMWFDGGLIPTYFLIRSLGLVNNFWVYVLPVLLSPWNTIVMRNFFFTIPESLEESAHISGANDLQVLTMIYLPLSKASLATIGLFYAVGHWNAWFDSMLYMTNRTQWTLQYILRQIIASANVSELMEQSTDVSAKPPSEMVRMACTVAATVPIICVYPFLQKYFVKGVLIGSVKG